MKKYLLDTHTLIWFIEGNSKLSPTAKDIIEQNTENLIVSIVSIWEIAIKISIGRLILTKNLTEIVLELIMNQVLEATILPESIIQLTDLPYHHRDPFDRLLIAIAKTQNLTIITKDDNYSKYDINVLW